MKINEEIRYNQDALNDWKECLTKLKKNTLFKEVVLGKINEHEKNLKKLMKKYPEKFIQI